MAKLFEKLQYTSRQKWAVGFAVTALVVSVSAAPFFSRLRVEKETANTFSAAQANAKASLGKLPLMFEPNRGQADPQVRFVGRAQGYTVMLTADDAVLRIKRDGVLRMKLQNAQP